MQVTIDNELRDLILPLQSDEFAKLEASILAEGVRDPLVLWNGVLVDGHHRHQICTKHGLEFPTVERQFADKRAARIWMRENQMARRNVSAVDRVLLAKANAGEWAAEAAERMRAGVKADPGDNCSQGSEKKRALKTSEKIAKAAGVSDRIVKQVDKIIESDPTPELMDALRSSEVSTNSGVTIAAMSEDDQREVVRQVREDNIPAAKVIGNISAAAKIEKRKEAIAEIEARTANITGPTGPFDVIVIDPPWPYADKKPEEAYNPDGRRAANPYPEMSLEEIAAIDLPAADDCVLWLWTTHKFLPDSFELLKGWGFDYKVCVTWRKDRMGLGSWLRSQSEFCIMAVKGKPIIQLTNQTTVIDGPLREHSRKPDEFYSMVDSLCIGRKIDWFSREAREGWVQYGNDEEKFSAVG